MNYFLFFLFSLQSPFSVIGECPDLSSKDMNEDKFKVVFIESGKLDQRPKNVPMQCIISRSLPKFSVLNGFPEAKIDFGISLNYSGKNILIRSFRNSNFSFVLSNDFQTKFQIVPSSTKNSVFLHNTKYSEIYNYSSNCYIFAEKYPSICQREKKIDDFIGVERTSFLINFFKLRIKIILLVFVIGILIKFTIKSNQILVETNNQVKFSRCNSTDSFTPFVIETNKIEQNHSNFYLKNKKTNENPENKENNQIDGNYVDDDKNSVEKSINENTENSENNQGNNNSSIFCKDGINDNKQIDSNEINSKIMMETITDSFSTGKDITNIIRAERQTNTVIFYKVSSLVLDDDSRFIFTYVENPNPSRINFESHLDFEFHSEEIKLKKSPEIEFVSYRDVIPAKINFTLDYNTSGVVTVPEDILVSFSKDGQSIGNVLMMSNKLGRLLSKNQFSSENYRFAFKKFCKVSGATRGYWLEDGQQKCSFLKTGYSPISDEELTSILPKLEKRCYHFLSNDVLKSKELCFVCCTCDQWRNIQCIMSYPDTMTRDTFAQTKSPVLMQFCLFAHHLSRAKEQNLRFDNFLNLLVSKNHFTFAEFTQDLKTLLFSKTSVGLAYKYDMDSFLDEALFVDQKDRQFLIDFYSKKDMKDAFVSQKVIEVNYSPFRFTSNCISPYYDKNVGQSILSLLVEDINEIVEQDKLYMQSLKDIEMAAKALNLHKFIIKKDDIFLVDDSIFNSLRVEPGDRSLKKIISSSDIEKIDLLRQPSKFTIALLNKKKENVWFSAMSNGKFGFLLCVNEFIEAHSESPQKTKNMTYSQNICMWSVDSVTDKVMKLFELPTIWDLLTVDKNTEFIKFANFVHSSKRDLFISKYSQIISGQIDSWSSQFPLLKIGGSYEWYRVQFIRAKNKRLFCIALNINQVKLKEIKLLESQRSRDMLFKAFKVMLWVFEDSNEVFIADDENLQQYLQNPTFSPGIQTYLYTNWAFFRKYMVRDDFEVFTEKMNYSLANNAYFEITATLKFERPYHVILQGKAASSVIGFCIDAEEIYKEKCRVKKELEEHQINRVESQKVREKNIFSQIRKLTCIYGALDVLSVKAYNNRQIWTIDLIRTMADQLFDNFQKDLSFYNILEVIELFMQISAQFCSSRGIKMEVDINGIFPDFVAGSSASLKIALISYTFYVLSLLKSDVFKLKLTWKITDNKYECLEIEANENPNTQNCNIFIANNVENNNNENNNDENNNNNNNNTIDNKNNNNENNNNENNNNENNSNENNETIDNENNSNDANGNFAETFTDKEKNIINNIIEDNSGIPAQFLANFDANFDKSNLKMTAQMNGVSYPHANQQLCDVQNQQYVIFCSDKTIVKQIVQQFEIFNIIHYVCQNENDLSRILDSKEKIISSFFTDSQEIKVLIEQRYAQPRIYLILDPNDDQKLSEATTLLKPLVSSQIRKFITISSGKSPVFNVFKPAIHLDSIIRTVLLVEDDKYEQFILAKMLETIKCSFMIVRTGEEAMKALEEEQFDIVIMECEIPVLDGFATTRMIRKLPKRYAPIPIVGISAKDSLREECLKAGMNAFYKKPLRIHSIKDALTKFSHV